MAIIPVEERQAAADEGERVEAWRLEQALRLGIELTLAERFAQSGADLEDLRCLIAVKGCSPDLAARILL